MDLFALTAKIGLDSSAFTSGLNAASAMMQQFANAVVQFGVDVVETGMNFDKQMSAVQAVLGSTEGTMENMAVLRAFALEQAHDSIFTAEQTGEAYYYMGMAGWKSEQMLAGLPGIMALAAASGEDLGMVSDVVTDSITAFGLSANDVSMYVDVLAAAATNANTDVARMGQTFQYVAPIAGQLGYGVDDIAVSLGILANAGIKGSQAGTTLRNIFTRLSTDAGASSKQLGALGILTEELGVQFYDSAGNARDWGTVLSEARQAWSGLSQEQQITYAKQIASQRGMAGWLALMNASEEDFEKLATAIDESAGAAKEMSETRLDNLYGDVVKFNSALDVLKIAIYDDVKGPLRELVQWGTGALDRITEAINENGLEGGIAQLGVEIESLGEKFAPMLESIGKALGPLLISLIDTVTPALTGSAVNLGSALATGLLQGITQGLSVTNNPFLQNIGQWFGLPGQDLPQYSSLGLSTDATEMTVEVTPEVQADAIQAAIDNAIEEGRGTIEIDGNEVSILEADRIAADVAAGLGSVSEVDGQPVADAVSGALANVDSSGLETAIESAGPPAGNALRMFIESALSGSPFNINVTANVSGLPNSGSTERHARSMSGGTILRGATVFGYNDRGHAMVGGGEGPEAVVGVNSLNTMIDGSVSNAVSKAMGEVLNRLDKIAGSFNRSMTVVLDTGVLVGEINNGLGEVQAWRGAGRA